MCLTTIRDKKKLEKYLMRDPYLNALAMMISSGPIRSGMLLRMKKGLNDLRCGMRVRGCRYYCFLRMEMIL